MVTLVLGEARSRKSRYAQQIAEATTNVLFVATQKHATIVAQHFVAAALAAKQVSMVTA